MPDADVFDEWIKNGADIESQKVIWAHDMGAAQNQALLDDFLDRTVWSLTVGADPRAVRPQRVRGP